MILANSSPLEFKSMVVGSPLKEKVFARVDDKDITKFDGNFMDWEFLEGTIIWTGKGPRKYENKTYLEAKKKFNRLGFATDNIWNKA